MPLDLQAFKPTPGADADAAQMANGFTALETWGNGAIDLAALKQTGATVGQALVWDGTKWAPGTATPKTWTYNTPVATAGAANALATLISQLIPAGTISYGGKRLRVTVGGQGVADTTAFAVRWLVQFGGVTLIDGQTTGSGNFAASARRAWKWGFDLVAQADNGHVAIPGSPFTIGGGSTITTGIGVAGTGDISLTWGSQTVAVDLTAAQTLTVQAAISQSSTAGVREFIATDLAIEVIG